jgi:hypothetical protein
MQAGDVSLQFRLRLNSNDIALKMLKSAFWRIATLEKLR